jgi:metallo-beta-lactamase family protein
MKVTFYGAAQNVTGSKHLIQTGSGEHILLDCGLHQGQRQEANRLNRSFPITAVV